MPKLRTLFMTVTTVLLSVFSLMLYGQKPTHVPGPQNVPGINFSDPFEVIVYIVIPVVLVVLYFLWRRQVKKSKQGEQEEEENKRNK